MATADTLIRTGDIISLGEFHQDFLTAMLDEDVPNTVTVGQARKLVNRMRTIKFTNSDMMAPFLADIEALLDCSPN
jgi:hypothetical protein